MANVNPPVPLLPEILQLHGKWLGDKTAVICDSEQLSWREFSQRINQVANGIISAGLKPGDSIVVLMSNGLPMAEALFGILASGCVSVPINLSVADEAIAGMINDADAKAIFCTEEQFQRIDTITPLLGVDQLQLRISTVEQAPDWINYRQWLDSHSTDSPDVTIAPDDYLNIIYSSGTTALPKGIVHTHRGRRDWAYDLAIALRYHGNAKTLLTIGLYSNISWVAMLTTLLAGGTIVIHKTFDAVEFLKSVEHDAISHTAMVPIQFQRVVEAARDKAYKLTSMSAMMSCGSPLHEGLKQEIFDIFPCGIIELYGLTEGIITTLQPEEADGRWSSVGKPLLGTDLCIIDDNDQEVATGYSGEIVYRGRITMPQYLNRPEETNKSIWTDGNERQWLRSGDIGYLDDQGYLFIVDRKKDMILSGGQNIYPQDIEAVLIDHPAVNDVAIIGARSHRWGETPIALVVPELNTDSNQQAIADWCNQRVGRQQRITEVIFIDELPRNPNGKILKRELRDQYKDREYE